MNRVNTYNNHASNGCGGLDYEGGDYLDPADRVEDFSVRSNPGTTQRSRSPYQSNNYNEHPSRGNSRETFSRNRRRNDNDYYNDDNRGGYNDDVYESRDDYNSERNNRQGRSGNRYREVDSYDNGKYNGERSERLGDRDRRNTSRYSDSSRNRSRSHSRDRGRDSSRDQRYSRDKRREDERVDDYFISKMRSRSQDRDSRRNYDKFESSLAPSSTVIVQGLSTKATEDMIKAVLQMDGVEAKTIAVIKDRNGDSRGFAFVEFDDVVTAELWLKITKRQVLIDDQRSYLNFSRSKKFENSSVNTNIYNDWNCSECGALNFGSKRKYTCFTCGKTRSENDTFDGNKNDKSGDVVKLEPCNVLMLRGMDFSTTEENIRLEISKLTKHSIYDVRLIKDKVTDMSRGFAFVELGSTEDAASLLDTIDAIDPVFEIEGRKITVGYARHGFNAPITNKKTVKYAPTVSKQTLVDNAVAQASAANSTGVQYSQSVGDTHSYPATSDATTSQYYGYQAGTTTCAQNYGGQPDLTQSTYSYDATTGFYYDSSTGLYYDPNSGYYYNGTTGQYLYWDGVKYQAVNQDGSVPTANQNSTAQEQKPPIAEDASQVPLQGKKPKDARKIAKDMERWAKKMNSANEAKKHAVKQAQDELRLLEQKEEELRKKIHQEKHIVSTLDTAVRNKDGVRSLFVPDNDEEGSVLKLGAALKQSSSTKPSVTLVTDVPEDDDIDILDEARFVDTVKLTCLLCKRQFPSHDVLTKHLQMSQLHKQNIEAFKKNKRR